MPVDRAMLRLSCDLVLTSRTSRMVGDVGCGSGQLTSYVAGRRLEPHAIDPSPEMVRVARRDHPGRRRPPCRPAWSSTSTGRSDEEVVRQLVAAGFRLLFSGRRPATPPHPARARGTRSPAALVGLGVGGGGAQDGSCGRPGKCADSMRGRPGVDSACRATSTNPAECDRNDEDQVRRMPAYSAREPAVWAVITGVNPARGMARGDLW